MDKISTKNQFRFEEIPLPFKMCPGINSRELYMMAHDGLKEPDIEKMLAIHFKTCDQCLALYCLYLASKLVNKQNPKAFTILKEKAMELFEESKKADSSK